MAVQIRSSAIDKAWRAAGEGSTWLLLAAPTHDEGPGTAFEKFRDSVASGNADAAGRGDDNEVFAEAPAPTEAGFVALMSRASDLPALRRFVEDLAVILEANGLAGSLTAAGDALAPTWANGGPVLAAFLAWVPDLESMARDPQRTSGWHVDADRTARITDLAASWGGPLTSRSIVRTGQHAVELNGRPTAPDVAKLLARGVTATGMAGIEIVEEAALEVRQAALAPGGEMVLQTATGADGEPPWPVTVRRLREALTALPADLHTASSPMCTVSRSSTTCIWPRWATLEVGGSPSSLQVGTSSRPRTSSPGMPTPSPTPRSSRRPAPSSRPSC